MSTTRPAAFGAPREGVEMTPCRYCVPENIIEGDVPQELDHIFHASADGAFVVGLWSCTECTERVLSYPTGEF